jgi:hypothetical protein
VVPVDVVESDADDLIDGLEGERAHPSHVGLLRADHDDHAVERHLRVHDGSVGSLEHGQLLEAEGVVEEGHGGSRVAVGEAGKDLGARHRSILGSEFG